MASRSPKNVATIVARVRLVRGARATCALLWFASGCGDPIESRKPELQAVRVASVPSHPSAASLWIGERSGAFRAQGLALEWVHSNRPSQSLPALLTGDIDVMVTVPSAALFSLMGRGEPVRIVADRGQQTPGACAASAILVRHDLDAARLPSPVRVVASSLHATAFVVDRLRASLGAGAHDWTLVEIPHNAEAQALATRAVDVLTTSEPYLTRLQEAGLARLWRTHAEIYPDLQSFFLVFGPRLLEREREVGERFLAAYLATERRLAQGKTDQNVADMAAALDLDQDLARRICWIQARDDLAVNAGSLLDFQRWAVTKGLLDTVVDPEQFWDGELATGARRMLARGT
jgi:ABC-type nitrate/sulfonate/bicarbonate transport system substrate-binding protein